MQVVLLRVGIDTGSGGIHGPLFKSGRFEYIPIWDKRNRFGVNRETYGNTKGKLHRRPLVDYFPERRREKVRKICIHHDPEFRTYTYGDPTGLKAGLKRLEKGDLLVFYAGLEGWDFRCDPALYIIGFFSVLYAGLPEDLAKSVRRTGWKKRFSRNFHVRHSAVFEDQKDRLVLVKGDDAKSRLVTRAVRISSEGQNCIGRPMYIVLSRWDAEDF